MFIFFLKWTIFFLCRLLFVLNVIFPIKTNNKLIYVFFSHFLYNTNPAHNFNQTYHVIIFDKIKSNHNFNQTHILYEPITAKVIFSKLIFSNHNHNNYHKNKHTQSCFCYPCGCNAGFYGSHKTKCMVCI